MEIANDPIYKNTPLLQGYLRVAKSIGAVTVIADSYPIFSIDDANRGWAKISLQTIEDGISSYTRKFNKHPSSLKELTELNLTTISNVKILDSSFLRDGWGQEYSFDITGKKKRWQAA